jgi:hypothetical protein
VSQFAGRAAAVAFVRDSDRGIQSEPQASAFRYYPGAYVLPGGRVDSCDADLKIAASRQEIDPRKLNLLRTSYTSARAAVDGQFITRPNPEEVKWELWIAARDALDIKLAPRCAP